MIWFMDKDVSTSKINLSLPIWCCVPTSYLCIFSNSEQVCRTLAFKDCAPAFFLKLSLGGQNSAPSFIPSYSFSGFPASFLYPLQWLRPSWPQWPSSLSYPFPGNMNSLHIDLPISMGKQLDTFHCYIIMCPIIPLSGYGPTLTKLSSNHSFM